MDIKIHDLIFLKILLTHETIMIFINHKLHVSV